MPRSPLNAQQRRHIRRATVSTRQNLHQIAAKAGAGHGQTCAFVRKYGLRDYEVSREVTADAIHGKDRHGKKTRAAILLQAAREGLIQKSLNQIARETGLTTYTVIKVRDDIVGGFTQEHIDRMARHGMRNKRHPEHIAARKQIPNIIEMLWETQRSHNRSLIEIGRDSHTSGPFAASVNATANNGKPILSRQEILRIANIRAQAKKRLKARTKRQGGGRK